MAVCVLKQPLLKCFCRKTFKMIQTLKCVRNSMMSAARKQQAGLQTASVCAPLITHHQVSVEGPISKRSVYFKTLLPLCLSEFRMTVPWGEVRGKVWGPEHGRPVLCLHGWADNCGSFNTLIPLLPKECRYVAMDLAGHGFSSHRPPGVLYTFPAYVADVRRVIDALQWKRFSIIGHSMGGSIAGMFSALYPEMVDSMVLLDSYGFLPTDLKNTSTGLKQGFENFLVFERKKEEKKAKVYTFENAIQRLRAANPSLSETSAHILLERGLTQVEGGVVFTRDIRINLKNIIQVSLEQSMEFLSGIQARVLLVLAEDGLEKIFEKPEQKKFISTLLEGYRDRQDTVLTVPGDHHVHLNSPETVAPIMNDFLRREEVVSQSAATENIPTAKL